MQVYRFSTHLRRPGECICSPGLCYIITLKLLEIWHSWEHKTMQGNINPNRKCGRENFKHACMHAHTHAPTHVPTHTHRQRDIVESISGTAVHFWLSETKVKLIKTHKRLKINTFSYGLDKTKCKFSSNSALDKAMNGQTDIKHEMWCVTLS